MTDADYIRALAFNSLLNDDPVVREHHRRLAAIADRLALQPTLDQAMQPLKAYLRDSKGWMMDYSESIIRDAIDRVPLFATPTTAPAGKAEEPDWKAEYYGAQEVLTKIRTALNASGRWALGESLFEAIDKLIASPPGEPVDQDEATFDDLCREHDIYGTAAARQCEVFWRAGQRALPAQESVATLKVGKHREWMLIRDLPEGEYRLALIGTIKSEGEA